jgi:hypothetical protein
MVKDKVLARDQRRQLMPGINYVKRYTMQVISEKYLCTNRVPH